MDKYVVRQPIKDLQNNVIGYEILFHGENDSLYNQQNDFAAADSISGFLMQNNDKLYNNKITFMTFTPNLLFRNTPKIFKQNDVVIQIEDNVIVHPLAQTFMQKYHSQGYKFAINDFIFAPRYFSMMEFVDYIKVNVKDKLNPADKLSLSNIIKMGKGFNKKCIATGVDTQEDFDTASSIGVDYLQGVYIAEILSTKANKMEYLQGNFFQLVVEVTKDDPDLQAIEEIIQRDASLSYAILKMVNSAYFALRHRTSSIRQALVILGIGQLKQWIYLMSFKQNDDKNSDELLKVSFLRATFCSRLIDNIREMPISKSEAYMMGMFSTLNYLIDAPIEDILEEIPVSDEIKEALISQKGRCGTLYNLVLSYEKADWKKITAYTEQLNIPTNIIAQIYFDCLEEVNQIWDSLTNPYVASVGEVETREDEISAYTKILEENAANTTPYEFKNLE